MIDKVNPQYNNPQMLNSQHKILDFLQFKSKLKNNDFTTLELVNGTILSLVGDSIHQLNEFTIASIAQNFATYIKKQNNSFKENIFVSHDGSLDGLLFSKIFASILISEDVNAYFNYDNKPLNDSLAIYVAQKSEINFNYVVTFTNQIKKNFHSISFFHKNGLHLNSTQSKDINSLISETNFLNLEIPNINVPSIKENNLVEEYINEIKLNKNLGNLNIAISDPFLFNSKLIETMLGNKAKYRFIDWKNKNPKNKNSVTRRSFLKTFRSKSNIIFNFTTDINNCEIIVKHKNRWKFISLNDLSLIYIYYKSLTTPNQLSHKQIHSSYLSSKYIGYYASKLGIKHNECLPFFDNNSIDQKDEILLSTNGTNYLITEHNKTLCSDPLINIQLALEMANYFFEKKQNLYQVLTSIYINNGIFHFRSENMKMELDSANIFFNRLKNLKTINGSKIVKVKQNESVQLSIEFHLQDKTIIYFEYLRNINQIYSNISVWNTNDQKNKNYDDIFMDLIIKEKNIINELNCLQETLNVTKFSWKGFIKYSVFVILFIALFYLMITFILGGDRNLWNLVGEYIRKEKMFSYFFPIFILWITIWVFISCWADKLILNRLNEKSNLRHLWVSNMISICISSITPLIYGGESVGYWYLRRKGMKNSSIGAMFLIKSLFTQINFIIFSTIFVPIGFVNLYNSIIESQSGVILIVLVILGTIFDIFSAIMISLLTFSSRLTSSLARIIGVLIEWIPFIISRDSNEKGSRLKYEFTSINLATKKIFQSDYWYKDVLFCIEILSFHFFFKIFDLSNIFAISGNFLLENNASIYLDLIVGQIMVRSVNAINFIVPSGIGISDWAYKNILETLFRGNNASDDSVAFYSITVFQTLTRIIFTFGIVILSALMLLTIFIGESRIDKYNKIKKTLTPEEISHGNVKVKTKFYSFSFIPWLLGIVVIVVAWILICKFVFI